jgi:hypothetical protein
MIKSRRMPAGEKGMHAGFLWKNQNEDDHHEDLDIDGRVILQWILQDGVVWTGLIWLKIGTSGGFLLTQ